MTPKKLLVLFRLCPGQSAADYERWAAETDLPTVNGLNSIDRFTVYRMTALFGSEGKPPYDYAELIEIADMPGFLDDIGRDPMPAVAARFQEFADVTFIEVDELGWKK
jgi:hypothetical protein